MDQNKIMNEEIVEETAPVTEEKNDDKSGLVCPVILNSFLKNVQAI